jgi:hypothetical protein
MRPLNMSDLDALTEIYQHPLVAQWIGAHTREDVERELGQHIETRATRVSASGPSRIARADD